MPGDTWPVATPVHVVRERVRARSAELDHRRRLRRAAVAPVALAVVGALVLSVGSPGPSDTRIGTTPASDVSALPDELPVAGGAPAPDGRPPNTPRSGDTPRTEAVPNLPPLGTTTTTAAPVPAPSGGDIAFTRDEAIWLMKSDGSNAVPITGDDRRLFDLDWRPDGKLLAATEREVVPSGGTSRNRVVLVSLDGRVVPLTPYEEWAHSPRWSPDGRRIAYQKFTGGGNEHWNDLWIMDADGSSAHELKKDFGHYQSWAPDGREIAYQCGRSGPVCVLNVDSGAVRSVPNSDNNLFATWAPTGRLTLIRTNGQNAFTVVTMRTDGTDKRAVVTLPSSPWPSSVTWSPKARSLAFWTTEQASCVPLTCPGWRQIWRVEADGSGLRALTSGSHDQDPDWSPAAKD